MLSYKLGFRDLCKLFAFLVSLPAEITPPIVLSGFVPDLTNKVRINMRKMKQAESYCPCPTGGGGDYVGNDARCEQ